MCYVAINIQIETQECNKIITKKFMTIIIKMPVFKKCSKNNEWDAVMLCRLLSMKLNSLLSESNIIC